MDFSANDGLSMETVLADVISFVGDKEMKMLPKGRYMSAIQRGIEELSLDTFFNIKRLDIPVPTDCLHVEMPAGTFSVKEVYGYNGDHCNPQMATKFWYKANYYTGTGPGFFAENRGSNTINDPFYPSSPIQMYNGMSISDRPKIQDDLFYYSVENGVMHLSSNARSFQMLHVVAHGTTCAIGEASFIPPLFREAVTDFACEYMLRELMAKDTRTYAPLFQVYSQRLDYNGFNGSWYKAKTRVNRMSKGQRADWYEYLSRWSW